MHPHIPDSEESDAHTIARELTRAKCEAQLRTIKMILGGEATDDLAIVPADPSFHSPIIATSE